MSNKRVVRRRQSAENGTPIGVNFSPASKRLSVEVIQKYLRSGFLEQRVYHHGNCGRIICKEKPTGRLHLPPIDRLPRLGLIGHSLRREEIMVSPVTDRKNKLAHIVECYAPLAEKLMDVDSTRSPSSKEQSDYIKQRLLTKVRFVGNKQARSAIEEIDKLWNEWNHDAALCCQHVDEIPKHICFDKKPPWDMRYDDSWGFISTLLDIHYAIRTNFFTKMQNELRIDWNDFFFNDSYRSYTEFCEELHRRIHDATYAARIQWPLEICQLLLNLSDKWTRFLLDQTKITRFLNSIASLQAMLISLTIRQNYEHIIEKLSLSNSTPTVRLKVEVDKEVIHNGINISTLLGELLKMGEKIPHAETKLYPRLFPHVKYIAVSVCHEYNEMVVRTPTIFGGDIQRISELRTDVEQYLSDAYEMERWETLMRQLNEVRSSVISKRTLYREQNFLFDFTEFKKTLFAGIDSQLEALVDSARSYLVDTGNRVEQLFLLSCAKLHNKSQTEQMAIISEVFDVDIPQLKRLVNAINEAVFAVIEYSILTDAIIQRCFYVSRLPSRLSFIANLVWHRLYVDREVIEKKILEQSNTMQFEAEMLQKELNSAQNNYRSSNTLSHLKRITHKFTDLHEKCTRFAFEYPILMNQLALFDLGPIRCDLPMLLHHITLFKRFSTLHLQIVICEENWLSSRVADFNKLEIPETVERLRKEFSELSALIEKEEDESVFDLLHQKEAQLEKILSKFVELLPILMALSNEGMKEYHWQEILGETKDGEETKSTMRVRDLIEMNVAEKAEIIEEVSAAASKEHVLEQYIKSMRLQWSNVTLTFAPYRDSKLELVVLTDQLKILLEAHIVRTQTILASPFVSSLIGVVREWADTLDSIDTFFSLYSKVKCESKWCYLEPIFTSEDVAYQMPSEWRTFKDISELWSGLNQQLKEHSTIIRITKEIPMILDTLRQLVGSFERMHEGFENFLRKKRLTFPRLFFLSDSELMDLLSRARNVNAISIFLPKLFSSVRTFEFTPRGEVFALLSDTERLQLTKPVSVALAKRHVEKWLMDVEKEMKRTVRTRLKEFVEEFKLSLVPFAKIFKRPSQIVLLYYKLSTTNLIEMALRQRCILDVIKLIDQRIAECLSLTNLSTNEANTVRIVLLHFIQCKQIVQKLASLGNSNLELIEWSKELRYYWSNGNVFVRMLNFSASYEYEFLSVSDLTIATRHTKKIIAQLITSERHGYSGMVVGPAATGKSHSVKELSRLFGRFFVMFNCSAEIPIKQITALIKGCILSGSTLCFDEFNRLSAHALTTTITIVLSIHKAISRGDNRVLVDGDELTVNTASAVHVTLNANLIGRSSLPANVDCAFRRLEVGASDCEQIAVTLLQMNKVPKYDIIARTIGTLLNESCIVMGGQLHLDFGLRAMRTIVTASITDNGHGNEIATAANAVRKVLSPAFTPTEDSTFSQVLKSITKIDKTSQSDMIRNAAIAIIASKSLTADETFIEKCYQLYELLSLRSAVIVFGQSMSGKSTLIDIVAEMTRTDERQTLVTVINPSLVDARSLFGYFDDAMLEWIPGIFSSILEGTLLKADNIQQWIILDGKAHSKWIESMNSLLDDNRILCLANGQTISLRENVRIIFEMDDLQFLAETTISRCGIVNMSPTVLAPDSLALIAEVDESNDSMMPSRKTQAEMKQLREIVALLEINDSFKKKLLIIRINILLRIWKNVGRTRQFQLMIVYIAAHCLIKIEELHSRLQQADEDLLTLFHRFPHAEVDWFDLGLSLSTPMVIPREFQNLLIERLLRFSNAVLLCGPSHAGKSFMWRSFCAQLHPNRWNITILHLSPFVDSMSLLKAILNSQLVRVGDGHYTGAEGKSVLFVLVGVDRLRTVFANSTIELLRAIFEKNCVVAKANEQIRFSNVHFIGEFTTADEQHFLTNRMEARLQRHWFPLWIGHQGTKSTLEIYKRIISNYCTQFVGANTELLEDVTKTEFMEAMKCSPPLQPLESAMASEQLLGVYEERFVINGLRHGPLVNLATLKADLIEKQRELETSSLTGVTISGYSSRHIALMMKVVHSDNGHCILIGDEFLGQQDICEFVACITECIFDAPGMETTLQQWDDILLKIVRSCIAENTRHVVFVNDSFHSDDMRHIVLGDLSVMVNNGGLPMRIFRTEIIEELIEKINFISPSQKATKWQLYNRICETISKNIHIMLCCSRNSFNIINSEHPNFLRYSVVDHYGEWSYQDKIDIAVAHLRQYSELNEQQVSVYCEQILKVHSFMPTLGIHSTPSSFLNLIETFGFLLKRRVEAIEKRQKRYKLGLEKLICAEQQMAYLQSELVRLQPELIRTSTETSMLMSKIEQETIEVENAREVVAADENRANAAATKAQTLKSESEQELADAIPALESAVDALKTMNQRDISTLKTMRFPPRGVRLCMEAVCILLGETPAKITDSLGGVKLDYWVKGQKLLSDIHFLSRIRSFDKDNVSKKTINIIRKDYLSKDEFDPEVVRQSSLAAEGLCLWVKAIDAYHTIATVVAPKREKLKKAELLVKQQMKQLDTRRKALQEVTERLQSLSDSFSHMSQRKQELLTQIQICEQRMSRTQRLIVALGGEKERWEGQVCQLNDELTRCRQYSLLAAIAIEYLSTQSPKKRKNTLDKIREMLKVEEPFNLQMICDEERRSENEIIIENTRRVPLIIQSRGQAKSFLKELTGGRLITVEASDKKLSGIIRDGISAGSAILIESLVEPLPSSIIPVLALRVFTLNNQQFVMLNGKSLPYNSSFRLYISTDKPRMNFSGAFLSKVRLSREVTVTEENLLAMLENSAELDDDHVTELLSKSKQLTLQRKSTIDQLNDVNERIERTRKDYLSVIEAVTRNVRIIESLADLLLVYRFPLSYLLELFTKGLHSLTLRQEDKSIAAVMNVSMSCFDSISSSLFEEHRRIFRFLLRSTFTDQQLILCIFKFLVDLEHEQCHMLRKLAKVTWQNVDISDEDGVSPFDIWKIHLVTDSRTPIALLVQPGSFSVLGQLEQLACSMKTQTQFKNEAKTLHIYSIMDIGCTQIDTVLQSGEWIIFENTHLASSAHIRATDEFLMKIQLIHLSSGPLVPRGIEDYRIWWVQKIMKLGIEDRQFLIRPFPWTYPPNNFKKGEGVNKSSRVFFAITSDDQPTKTKFQQSKQKKFQQSFLDQCLLIALEIPKTMPNFIKFYYEHGRASEINELLNTEQKRSLLYRLCLLHFAIRQRCEYGIHGWSKPFEVGDVELQLALSLFQELSSTKNEISLEELRANVLDMVYLSKMDNAFDAHVFGVFCEWFFNGINHVDNTLVEKLIPKAFHTKAIIHHTRSMNVQAHLLSGLHRNVEKYYERKRLQKISERIRAMFSKTEQKETAVFRFNVPSNETVEEINVTGNLIVQCVQRELNEYQRSHLYPRRQAYLRSLLSLSTIDTIDVSQIERPSALISSLRIEYSAKQGITFDEVVCSGRLSRPLESEQKHLRFLGCVLLGCRYDEKGDEIAELTSDDVHQKLKGVWVRADRRTKVADERIAITLHDRDTLEAILEVHVNSTIPATHWTLRGVRILTFMPT